MSDTENLPEIDTGLVVTFSIDGDTHLVSAPDPDIAGSEIVGKGKTRDAAELEFWKRLALSMLGRRRAGTVFRGFCERMKRGLNG